MERTPVAIPRHSQRALGPHHVLGLDQATAVVSVDAHCRR